eukprot:TRINITY_DN1230_c0_g1_i1.p1 TRINITY_DN1230_c0_g1~~TRINITY_DN1230_c0_g1_i1.p1  ORF type:complete len:342 (-),score=121.65 TRINITY_DN1230_c0_g1_i1:418-1443(-)
MSLEINPDQSEQPTLTSSSSQTTPPVIRMEEEEERTQGGGSDSRLEPTQTTTAGPKSLSLSSSDTPLFKNNLALTPPQAAQTLIIETSSSAQSESPIFSSETLPPELSFEEDVLQTWCLQDDGPTDEFIKELLRTTEEGSQADNPLEITPSDLLPVMCSPCPLNDYAEETPSLLDSHFDLKPLDASEIPTVLLEGDEEEDHYEEIHSSILRRKRGRPRAAVPKAPLGQKRARGRPLGSVTKNRIIPVPLSDNEAKYFRTRELNNAASRRCRINRKQKLQYMLMEEVELRERNALLKDKLRMKEELIERLKAKLINAAESSSTILFPSISTSTLSCINISSN